MAEHKKFEKLGLQCRFCGGEIVETDRGWGCSNFKGGCRAFLFKEDFFMKKVFGKKLSKPQALAFLKGKTVTIKGAVVKGKKCDATLTWGKNEEGKFSYNMDLDFGGSK